MAIGVHLMLVAALAFGVHWKMSNPETVEAEVWADIPRAAVPQAEAPPPPPPVVEQPVEKPPETPPEPVKAVEPEPPLPQPVPDVVVSRTQPKKELKKRKHREPVEVFETEPPKPVKKPEQAPPKKPVEVKPEPKPVSSKATSADGNAKAAAEREAIRKAKLQDMMSELGSLGTPSRSAGPSAAYGGRIKARIKPNIVFTDNVSGNPVAVVEVRCGPDGRILSTKFIERSGLASWDEAVMRALDRTEVLPADESGRVPPVMQLEFRPKDF